MADDRPNGVWGWIDFAVKIAQVLIIPLAIWLLTIERRITKIEANRFTSHDAQAVYELIGEKADVSDVPPAWFQRQVEDVVRRMNEHERSHP